LYHVFIRTNIPLKVKYFTKNNKPNIDESRGVKLCNQWGGGEEGRGLNSSDSTEN